MQCNWFKKLFRSCILKRKMDIGFGTRAAAAAGEVGHCTISLDLFCSGEMRRTLARNCFHICLTDFQLSWASANAVAHSIGQIEK